MPWNDAEELQHHIKLLAEKILVTQDDSGMISSYTEITARTVTRTQDLPRQAMATMALSMAQTLIPSLELRGAIDLSYTYIYAKLEGESRSNKLFIYLYLALAQTYSGQNSEEYIKNISEYSVAEICKYPIATNLYLRLSLSLPKSLPEFEYIAEVQRHNLSIIPKRDRFFDHADTLIWAQTYDARLTQKEYEYLLWHKTGDDWFKDMRTNVRCTASVVGKLFEVFVLYEPAHPLAQRLYEKLLGQVATSQYAKDVLGAHKEHIVSEPDTLLIDDVHTHMLVGLCYRYQTLR